MHVHLYVSDQTYKHIYAYQTYKHTYTQHKHVCIYAHNYTYTHIYNINTCIYTHTTTHIPQKRQHLIHDRRYADVVHGWNVCLEQHKLIIGMQSMQTRELLHPIRAKCVHCVPNGYL
jgi:hypothetical protein